MARVRYACPRCNKTYETVEQAANCTKVPADHFKAGDVVWDGSFSGIYRIDYVEMDRYAAGVTRIDLASVARGFRPRKDEFEGRGYLIGGYWCKANLFPIEEARKLLREAKRESKRRVEAAEALVKMVESSNETAEVAS